MKFCWGGGRGSEEDISGSVSGMPNIPWHKSPLPEISSSDPLCTGNFKILFVISYGVCGVCIIYSVYSYDGVCCVLAIMEF